MTCRELIEHLPDHLEGALPHPTDRAVRRHVARCRGCRAYLAQYRATLDAIHALAEWEGLESEEGLEVSRLLATAASRAIQ